MDFVTNIFRLITFFTILAFLDEFKREKYKILLYQLQHN